MKRYLFFVLALLLTIGVASAANIPTAVDPQNGPEVWTMEVYNDSGGALTSGSVVVWDYTDDDMYKIENRKMYITTTTTADDIAVAGVVVDDSIPAGSVGTIAIYGPVKAKASNSGVTAGYIVGTGTTEGTCDNYSNTGDNDGTLGWGIRANSEGTKGGGTNIPIIFVNPHQDASP